MGSTPGSRIDNIKANVQPKTIFVNNMNILIEEGDLITHKIPSGEETFEVVDRGFMSGRGGIPSHYQVKVRRPEKDDHPRGTLIQAIGDNSRINVNSIDSSININVNEDNIFSEMKKTISSNISDNSEREALLKIVDELKDSKRSPRFIDKYKEFISLAADHITLFSPLIPILTKFI